MLSDTQRTVLDVFSYIRLRQGIRSITPGFPEEPRALAPMQHILGTNTASKLVSRIYNMIHTQRELLATQSRVRWEKELGIAMTDEQWEDCCLQTERVSASSRLRIIHYKFLHRLYYTPAKMYKYKFRDNDSCDRCHAERARFLHLVWECPGVRDYWTQVFNALQTMIATPLAQAPLLALLGYVKPLFYCQE